MLDERRNGCCREEPFWDEAGEGVGKRRLAGLRFCRGSLLVVDDRPREPALGLLGKEKVENPPPPPTPLPDLAGVARKGSEAMEGAALGSIMVQGGGRWLFV
jgi:hypothetical protein